MAHTINLKRKAVLLRKRGYSIKEVGLKLGISKSTSSIWLRDVSLSSKAEARLRSRKIFGQYKARQFLMRKAHDREIELATRADQLLSTVVMSRELSKLCCALIYFCEGNKQTTQVRFTNSDPSLVKTFMFLFRSAFDLDEAKFRGLVHLHGYHNEEKQKLFWSKITNIPLSQFNRSYLKPNSGVRKHKDYAGCLAISYYDAKIAKELVAIYNAFVLRGVG